MPKHHHVWSTKITELLSTASSTVRLPTNRPERSAQNRERAASEVDVYVWSAARLQGDSRESTLLSGLFV
jgi:hypothetical protein